MPVVRITALRPALFLLKNQSFAGWQFAAPFLFVLLFICFSARNANAQSTDSTRTPEPRQIETANTNTADTSTVNTNEPSTSPAKNSRLPANHSPRRALLRGLTLPGGGQIHNRQFWKLPFVYAGLGTMTWFSIQANRNHKLYTRAFQYKEWLDEVDSGNIEVHPFPEFEEQYNEVLTIEGCTGDCVATASRLEQIRDNFRRNRDLSRFGIGLVYGLSIIDAFVSAHLLDFDVSEDLTVQILPHPNGATALLHIGF